MNQLLVIHTALPLEAKLLKTLLGLKKNTNFKNFEVYQSNNVNLICSGIGKVAAAAACSSLLTSLFKDYEDLDSYMLNFGFAAGDSNFSIGELVLANKIIDCATDHSHFPDILLRHPFKEATLNTVDTPVNDQNQVNGIIDMEASAIFKTASMFISSSRIASLKIISDQGSDKAFSKKFTQELFEKNATEIQKYINSIFSFLTAQQENKLVTNKELVNQLVNHLDLTETQAHQLHYEVKAFTIRNAGTSPNLGVFLHQKAHSKKDRNLLLSQITTQLQNGSINDL